MKKTLLFFDIGNTNTKIGVVRPDPGPDSGPCIGPDFGPDSGPDFGPNIGLDPTIMSYVLPSNDRRTADEFGLSLLQLLAHLGVGPDCVGGALASSVVPGMAALVSRACKRFLGLDLLFAPEDVPVPLENRYARPHEVGADRLVGAWAARRLFPDAASIISVDYGTATTFDCVEDNAYLGGLICPGVLSSVSALAAGTAKLPRISLAVEDREPAPGRSTATSLNHGFVFGFAAMTEGLIARLSAGLPAPLSVVGTGGFATAIAEVTDCFQTVRPDLLLDGLRRLYAEQVAGQE